MVALMIFFKARKSFVLNISIYTNLNEYPQPRQLLTKQMEKRASIFNHAR